jgi:hypothetical protein
VLLTRSPLRHPPEGGASLDLHVLSTPPAFVLSQDQTLRVCIYDSGQTRSVDTKSYRLGDGFNHWSYELTITVLARCTKGISSRFRQTGSVDESYFMALTFGTLLSSQGADAHRRGSLRAVLGQPELRYPVSSAGVKRPQLRPASHLVAAHGAEDQQPRRVALGGCSLRPHPISDQLPGRPAVAPCCEQGEH